MEKLIVHKPFDYNGVYYRQGMQFKPKDAGDAEEKLKAGFVRRKSFARPGESAALAVSRKLETRNAEQKLADQTVEKAEDDGGSEDDRPKRRGRPRLSPKKDD